MSKQTKTKRKSNKKIKTTEVKVESQKTKLDSKTQLQVLLFSILTFGVFYILLNIKLEKNKKQIAASSEVEQTLLTTKEIPFKVETLLEHLGSLTNIVNVDATLNSLKVEVDDASKVDIDGIKKIGAKGILKNGNKISIVFGDYATHLQKMIVVAPKTIIQRNTASIVSDTLDIIPSFYQFITNGCEKPQIIVLNKVLPVT